MRQLLLVIVLLAVPVAAFSGFMWLMPSSPPKAAAAGLGDMTAFSTIVTDVTALSDKGDLAGAATRIADLETAWDDAEATLRPVNPDQWGTVDDAIDAALKALRAGSPDAATVKATLASLTATLADPTLGAPAAGGPSTVAGTAVTDQGGHPIPCETMLTSLRDALAKATLSDADKAKVADLQARATERCNADDDRNADALSAQGLALVGQ